MSDAPSLEALLLPVSAEAPVGEFLLYDGTYDRIREARRSEDPSLPRDIWLRDLKTAEWDDVERLCVDALTTRTKDVQIAAWLLEALMHRRGFAGLAEGLDILLRMCEAFWAEMYPPLDADGEYRSAPFCWMNEKLVDVLFTIPVARPATEPEKPATWADWKQALWNDNVRQRVSREQQDVMGNGISRSDFLGRVAATPAAFHERNLDALTTALERVRDIEAFLDVRMGETSPSLVAFREAIAELRGWLGTVVRRTEPRREEREMPRPESAELAPDTKVESPPPRSGASHVPGQFNGRDDAYRHLQEAARYLQQIEPHSPAPYLVLRAVGWGGMTLDELLREFMRSGIDLAALATLLGLEEDR